MSTVISITKSLGLRRDLERYLESGLCFRDYEILPKYKFGQVNKVGVHQVLTAESIYSDIDNALYSFERHGFPIIYFYI